MAKIIDGLPEPDDAARAAFKWGPRTYAKVAIDRLDMHEAGQRLLTPSRLRDMQAAPFDSDAAHTIVVAEGLRGRYNVLDGVATAALAHINGATDIWCDIRTGLTLKRQAEIFLTLNKIKPVTRREKFRIGVEGTRDPTYTDIISVVHCYKFDLVYRGRAEKTRGEIGAVGTVENIWRKYGKECLDNTLYVIRKAFGSRGIVQANALGDQFLAGMADYMHGTTTEPATVVAAIGDTPASEIWSYVNKGNRSVIRTQLVGWMTRCVAEYFAAAEE